MLPLAEIWGLICIKQACDGAGCPTCGHLASGALRCACDQTGQDAAILNAGSPRDEPLAGTSPGDSLQVDTMDDLTAVIGIIVCLETQGFGQVAHRGVAGGVNRIHLAKTVLASCLDQMLHQ